MILKNKITGAYAIIISEKKSCLIMIELMKVGFDAPPFSESPIYELKTVTKSESKSFEETDEINDYQFKRKLYSHITGVGASEEVINWLIENSDISNVEVKMARRAAEQKSQPQQPQQKKSGKTTQTSEKYSSAAQMFKDLIMAGKMTDDEIFTAVKNEFGLDDSKKGYVKWYRNNLSKQGKNPPAAKRG